MPHSFRTSKSSTALLCLLAALIVPVLGCGDGNISRVSGNVTFGGKPVQLGTVVFEPTGGGSQATTLPIKDGKYEAAAKMKLIPGKYIVRITAPDLSKSNPDAPVGPNDPAPVVYPLLPGSWNVQSQLQVELKPGNNTVNFSGTGMQPPQAEVAE